MVVCGDLCHFVVVCGRLRWFVVVWGGLRWFAVVCLIVIPFKITPVSQNIIALFTRIARHRY